MRASTGFLRLLWRSICWKAGDESESLADALKALLQGTTEQVATGMYVTHTSVGGQSAAFTLPRADDLSTQDIAEAFSYLYDVYTYVVKLVPVKRRQADFTLSGWYP